MEFDDLLRQAEYSSDTELVGVTMYYLEEHKDSPKMTTGEVRDLLEESRASINIDAISSRIKDLRGEEVSKAGEEGRSYLYSLTHDGFDKFQELSGDLEEADKIRDDRFLDTDRVEVEYYSTLVDDINKSYQYGINDGCLVLTRKLFENLIIDILRAEYGGEGISLYFNTENGRFHGLGTLCGKLNERSSDLKHYSRQLDNGLVDRVEQFKEHGNSQAHSVRVDIDTDELEGMSEEATKLTNTLYDIREEVRIANGSSEDSE